MYIFNQLEATALLSLSGDLTNQSAPYMFGRPAKRINGDIIPVLVYGV